MPIVYRSVKGSALTSNEVDGNFEFLEDGKVSTTGDETIAGVKTFSSIPVGPGSDPTTNNQLTRKSYVDGKVSNTAYDATSWNGVSDIAPSKDAVRDKIESLDGEKLDKAGDTMSGNLNMGLNIIDDVTRVGDVSANAYIEFGPSIVSLNNTVRIPSLTANTVPYLNGTQDITSSAVTPTELGHLSGVTSAIQTQINAKQALVNSATALVDGATMDLTAIKHTLTTSSATRTFTISYTGDDTTLEITLNTTASVLTFPATSLCVSEGVASGDNTCSLSGVSGDKYIIAIKKIGSNYYVACKNFGQ